MIEPGLLVWVPASSGRVQAELLALAHDLQTWGARVAVIGDSSLTDLMPATVCIRISATVPE